MPGPETMRAAQVPEAGAPFELVDRPVPEPATEEVRIAVDACGMCRGDDTAREGHPEVEYPRIPGHELVGTVDAVGEGVTEWSEGDRVGVGWHGGHCFQCEECRRGDFVRCANKPITGLHRDGGYAEYTTARSEAALPIPDGLDAADAAPLLCAGLTTFNALRNADVRAGDLVAVLGIGGLGHLGVQYARQAGMEVVAISRGTAKRDAALERGADHFVDSEAADPGEALQDLGGADLVLATAPSADAIEAVVPGLGTDGDVVVVGIPEDGIPVSGGYLAAVRGSISGWPAGTPQDALETLAFSALRDVTPDVERYDLGEAEAAYQRMVASEVQFRAVLEP